MQPPAGALTGRGVAQKKEANLMLQTEGNNGKGDNGEEGDRGLAAKEVRGIKKNLCDMA